MPTLGELVNAKMIERGEEPLDVDTIATIDDAARATAEWFRENKTPIIKTLQSIGKMAQRAKENDEPCVE